MAWPATFLLVHGRSSIIGNGRRHDASLSGFRDWLEVTEVPATPVRSIKSLESRLGAAIRTILRIEDSPSLCSNPPPAAASHSGFNYNSAANKLPEGVTMSNLENALRELREKRSQAQIEIDKLDQVIAGIESLNGTGVFHKATQPPPMVSVPGKRTMSAAGRRRISLAQKARWAKVNGQAPKPKHTMSAAGRKRIAAASRARWAAFRAAKKKAA